jgi:hypothetical protein
MTRYILVPRLEKLIGNSQLVLHKRVEFSAAQIVHEFQLVPEMIRSFVGGRPQF